MATTIRIGKKKYAPLFDLAAWEMIDDQFGGLDELLDKLNDQNDAAKRRKTVVELAVLLINNGLEAKGEAPTMTEAEAIRGIPPKYLPQVRTACVEAINAGMRSDYDEADEEPVDVVLEEIAKKTNPGE